MPFNSPLAADCFGNERGKSSEDAESVTIAICVNALNNIVYFPIPPIKASIHHSKSTVMLKFCHEWINQETVFAASILSEVSAPPISNDIYTENLQPVVSPSPMAPELLSESSSTTIPENRIEQTPKDSTSSDDDQDHVPLAEINQNIILCLDPLKILKKHQQREEKL